MMLPEGQSLSDLYDADDWAVIKGALQEKLGPMAVVAQRMKPVAVAGLLMLDEMEATASTTIDQFLWKEAQASGCTTRGIESMAEQLAVLDSMPPSILLEVVTEGASDDSVLMELRNAYVREDLEMISDLIDSVSSVEAFMQQLNDNRNVIMAERFAPLLEEGNVFIAVGTAHLPGSQGVLELLRKRGYSVTPVLGGRRSQWLGR